MYITPANIRTFNNYDNNKAPGDYYMIFLGPKSRSNKALKVQNLKWSEGTKRRPNNRIFVPSLVIIFLQTTQYFKAKIAI